MGPEKEIRVSSPRRVAEGAPPEQFSKMSPTRSLKPSVRTMVGTAVARQFTPLAGCAKAARADVIKSNATFRRMNFSNGRIQ
jgi:hypothetical protein